MQNNGNLSLKELCVFVVHTTHYCWFISSLVMLKIPNLVGIRMMFMYHTGIRSPIPASGEKCRGYIPFSDTPKYHMVNLIAG